MAGAEMNIQTTTLPLNALTPHPENYNTHPASQIKELAESLSTFGQFKNIVTWTCPENMTTPEGHELHEGLTYILAGHGLWLAAMEAGVDELEVKDYSGISYEMAIGLLLVDNAAPLGSEPDAQRLAALLERTREMTVDRPGLGAMLNKLKQRAGINGHQKSEDKPASIDKAAELQKKWQVKLGDVWELDRHRIVCGDCTDRAVVESVTNGQRPEATITDPPYAFGLSSTSEMATKSGGWHDIMNNSSWFVDRYRQWAELLGDNGPMWIFGNWRTLPILMRAGFDSGYGIDSVMVWYKDWIGPGGIKALRPTYELIALTILGDYAIPDRSIEDFFKAGWSSYKPTGHRAEKPVELLSHLVNVSSVQTIFDPFLGSGTTLVASHELGRRCFGIEIEPAYCSVTLERASLLGITPNLVSRL